MTMATTGFEVSGGNNQFVPNANTAVQNIYQASDHNNRLVTWLRKLQEQVDNDIQIQEKMDSIRRYHTKLPHTLGLKRKRNYSAPLWA